MTLNPRMLQIAVVAGLTGLGAGALAQTTRPMPPTDQQQAALPEKDINAFAAAATEMRTLNDKWLPRVKAASEQGAAAEQQVKSQALAEMTQAVERNGLTVARYNEIYEIIQANPEVLRRVRERMPPTGKSEEQDQDDDDDGN
jgi:hypothetical protein